RSPERLLFNRGRRRVPPDLSTTTEGGVMGFFDRKKADTDHGSTDDHKFDVPGLAEFASTAGWKPLGAQPLKSPFDDFVNWASKGTVGEMAEGGLNSTVRA